jgi:quinol monooxygenase YgiN
MTRAASRKWSEHSEQTDSSVSCKLTPRIPGSPLHLANMAGVLYSLTIQINPDYLDEFMELMKGHVAGCRAEPGCLRFDFLKKKDSDNEFIFYEAYVDDAASAAHRETEHFKRYIEFRKREGVVVGSTFHYSGEGIDFQ